MSHSVLDCVLDKALEETGEIQTKPVVYLTECIDVKLLALIIVPWLCETLTSGEPGSNVNRHSVYLSQFNL